MRSRRRRSGNPHLPGQFPFSWTVAHGQTQEGSIAIRYATEGEQARDVPLTGCPDEEELEVPASPGVSDPCDAGNATWNVPADTAVLDWELVDGELIVTILAENTVFEGTDETTHGFGEADETNTDACEVLGEQLEIPAEPEVKDPCGAGNATWVVPADSDELDWTLTGGALSVEITAPDTVFPGGQDTSYSFGTAPETNTDDCGRRRAGCREGLVPGRTQSAVAAGGRGRSRPDGLRRPAPAADGGSVTHNRSAWCAGGARGGESTNGPA